MTAPGEADVDGDGRAEIVAQSAGGVVHCLDGPPRGEAGPGDRGIDEPVGSEGGSGQ